MTRLPVILRASLRPFLRCSGAAFRGAQMMKVRLESTGRADRGYRRRRDLRPGRRRARADGRDRRADPRHVGRLAADIGQRQRRGHPLRGGRLLRQTALAMPFAALEGVRRGCRAVVTRRPRGAARPTAGSAASSTPWASRSTARGRCRRGLRPTPSATRRRRRMRGSASARRSISACARSIPSSPSAAASAWASSPAPASASRCCCRCWPATSPPTCRSSAWSANAAARCRSSCRTISAPPAWRARWSWSRPRTSRR